MQATAYSYLTGKTTEFDYIVIPKEPRYTDGGALKNKIKESKPYRAKTVRTQLHYDAFLNRLRAFVRDTDLHNDYKNFKPWPNQKDTNYGWCDTFVITRMNVSLTTEEIEQCFGTHISVGTLT